MDLEGQLLCVSSPVDCGSCRTNISHVTTRQDLRELLFAIHSTPPPHDKGIFITRHAQLKGRHGLAVIHVDQSPKQLMERWHIKHECRHQWQLKMSAIVIIP